MYEVKAYRPEDEKIWDEFVMSQAIGGTFLQSRRFLNYHPKGRFIDASLLIYDKGKLVAVCPACRAMEDKQTIFYSHKGATFGGILFSPRYYHAEKVISVIQIMENNLKQNGYTRILLKLTPDLFSKESGNLLEYCLQNQNYQSYAELNTYIDLEKMPESVLLGFDRNKNRNIEKCLQHNLTFRELLDDQELVQFHALLTKNLEKYNLKPIHKVEEIKEFRNHRLQNETKFYGVFSDNVMMAAGMMFVFCQSNVIHAQNLSADYTFTEYSPITYLYYKVIEAAKSNGFDKLSWGISTENQGKDLNLSLIRNKESYGSRYSLNKTFYKDI